jgi:hypothetical protein
LILIMRLMYVMIFFLFFGELITGIIGSIIRFFT